MGKARTGIFRRTGFFLTIYILVHILGLGPALSQQVSGDSVKVTAVEIIGNKAVSTQNMLTQIKTKEGSAFDQTVLSEDLKRLYRLGYFSDINVDVQDYQDGKKVLFTVKEKPLLKQILLKGNKALKDKELRSQIEARVMDFLDPQQIKEDEANIKRAYIKKGYSRVEIESHVQIDEKTNEAVCHININEGEKTRVKKITLVGNKAFKKKKILKLMGTRRDTLFTSGFFRQEVFEKDLEKIEYFYKEQGYLDIKVEHRFEFDKRRMHITLNIDEGRKYLVGTINIKGNIVYPENELLAQLDLASGDVFNQTAVRQQAFLIQGYYSERGYVEARVIPDTAFNPQTERLDLVFQVIEGGIFYIDHIDIRGNTKTKDVVIRRELRALPGERFDGSKIQRSRERLYNLDFFEEVYFDTEPSDEPGKKNLVVKVKEAKTGEFSFGAGYSSIDHLIGFVQVAQKNFDWRNFPTFTGDGQQLKLKAEFGARRKDYELSWTEPWIFDRPISFGFDLYSRTRQRRDYDEARRGGDIRLGKNLSEWTRLDGVYKLEEVKIFDIASDAISDVRSEEGRNKISSLSLILSKDTRDNIFNPARGLLRRGSVEVAGGPFGADKDFIKYDFLTSWYYEYFKKSVLELKLRGGYVENFGDTGRVPIYERFFAGGATTIRGYEDQYVGPLESGDPVGGKALLLANAEWTFPLVKNLKLAFFYDTGYAWAKPSDVDLSDIKSSIGTGIRIKTPIGPVKLDYGYGLDYGPEDKDDNGRFHFSMSHGF